MGVNARCNLKQALKKFDFRPITVIEADFGIKRKNKPDIFAGFFKLPGPNIAHDQGKIAASGEKMKILFRDGDVDVLSDNQFL